MPPKDFRSRSKRRPALGAAALVLGLTVAALVPLPVSGPQAAQAQSTADGASLYTAKLCHTCHGPAGQKPIAPNYPKLAGQNAVYAAAQIRDIRDGKRTNGLSVSMRPMVAKVTDSEIDAIAKYLASVKP